MTDSVEINPSIIEGLTSGCKAYNKAKQATDKATATLDTMTDKILVPAIQCGSLASWDAHRAELDRSARAASKSVQRDMGYITEERTDKAGNVTLHVVPEQTMANIFTIVRQSYVRSLPFTDSKGNQLSFDKLKSNKADAVRKEAEKAKGRKGDQFALAETLKTIKARAKNLSDEELHNLVNRMKAEAKTLPTSKAKAA
jgi:hypothetical protein